MRIWQGEDHRMLRERFVIRETFEKRDGAISHEENTSGSVLSALKFDRHVAPADVWRGRSRGVCRHRELHEESRSGQLHRLHLGSRVLLPKKRGRGVVTCEYQRHDAER